MAQKEIARLDENGMLIAVESCDDAHYRTDPVARTVQLDPGHDMHNRLRQYRFNWQGGMFVPLSQHPIDVEDRETDGELVDALVEAVEDVADFLSSVRGARGRVFAQSERTARVLRHFRKRRGPRRPVPQPQIPEDAETTITVDADLVVVGPE